jgi:hypothetical protein
MEFTKPYKLNPGNHIKERGWGSKFNMKMLKSGIWKKNK